MVWTARGEPALRGRWPVRRRFPHGPGHGQPGQRLVRLARPRSRWPQSEPVAEVRDADDDGGPVLGVEDEPDRILAITDPSGWISSEGRPVAIVGQTSSM